MPDLFHSQNGSINLEAIEEVIYERPETMKGALVATLVMLSGATFTLVGDVAERFRKHTAWEDHGDGPLLETEDETTAPEVDDAASSPSVSDPRPAGH